MLYWASIMKMTGILLVCYYIFCKSINNTPFVKQKILSVSWCLFWAVLYAVRPSWLPEIIVRMILCTAFIIFIWKVVHIKLDTALSAYMLSYGIGYCIIIIATVLIGLVFAPFLSTGYQKGVLFDFDKPIYLVVVSLIAAFQFLLAYLLFRIKRFRNGFPFLFKKYAVILALIVSGIVLAFVSLITTPKDSYNNSIFSLSFAACVLIVGAGIIIWIRRGIKRIYKENMKDRLIEQQAQELDESKKEKQLLLERDNISRSAVHKMNHRFTAWERCVAMLAERVQSDNLSLDEIREEISTLQKNLEQLSEDFQNTLDLTKGEKPLPSTKIKMLDDLFTHFSEKFSDNKIDFNLKVNGSIPYMVENIIPQSKLETMIGDHLQDALIAINASDNSFRSILVVLGLAGDYYEFGVFDSGIPFEVDTLIHLGTERITTYADKGGSGIGFMTTFETMQECSASLVIDEKEPSIADYSKSVTIRFDGKNQYIIETYRPKNFPIQNGRYMVVEKDLIKQLVVHE